MTELGQWFMVGTAWLWLILAAAGIVLRLRRLVRLRRIVLVEPIDPRDVVYLAQIRRSTYFRLTTKVVLLLGGLIAVFDGPVDWLWPFWRVGVVIALAAMCLETISVDRTRLRLGRPSESVS